MQSRLPWENLSWPTLLDSCGAEHPDESGNVWVFLCSSLRRSNVKQPRTRPPAKCGGFELVSKVFGNPIGRIGSRLFQEFSMDGSHSPQCVSKAHEKLLSQSVC